MSWLCHGGSDHHHDGLNLIIFSKEEIVEIKELKKTLAGLGLAGLIAGAGVAVPSVTNAGSS